jgi:cobyrinic acid a,c-diamide synthase
MAAMVTGYHAFDKSLNLAGVILNGIGSEGHLKICKEAIEHYTGIKVLGHLPRHDDLSLPERHLGLIPTVEGPASNEFLEALTVQCEASLDIPEILRIAEQTAPLKAKGSVFPSVPVLPVSRIAVAKDMAFSFYYQDSLDILEAWGAEIVPFSPLQDSVLPDNISGLYIGGGFPELYAEALAANDSIKQEIKNAAGQGMPVYAECGGLMYLGEDIKDFQGKDHRMSGVLPFRSRIDNHRLSLGYRTVQSLSDGPLLNKGETVRGHEFHWSVLEKSVDISHAYRIVDKGNIFEGFHRNNVLASYVHLHLGSLPSMAVRFIENCRRFKETRKNGGHQG